jgi:DNA-binding transcriptional regulator YhcF (GntR family)
VANFVPVSYTTSLTERVVEQIRDAIVRGDYEPGDKLPSVRDLAAEAAVNPNTMQKALVELERNELIYTNRTSGRYITSDEGMIKKLKQLSAKNQIIDFLDKMKQLGFDTEEILDLITETIKEIS